MAIGLSILMIALFLVQAGYSSPTQAEITKDLRLSVSEVWNLKSCEPFLFDGSLSVFGA